MGMDIEHAIDRHDEEKPSVKPVGGPNQSAGAFTECLNPKVRVQPAKARLTEEQRTWMRSTHRAFHVQIRRPNQMTFRREYTRVDIMRWRKWYYI